MIEETKTNRLTENIGNLLGWCDQPLTAGWKKASLFSGTEIIRAARAWEFADPQ
jgi:hypothetical protein